MECQQLPIATARNVGQRRCDSLKRRLAAPDCVKSTNRSGEKAIDAGSMSASSLLAGTPLLRPDSSHAFSCNYHKCTATDKTSVCWHIPRSLRIMTSEHHCPLMQAPDPWRDGGTLIHSLRLARCSRSEPNTASSISMTVNFSPNSCFSRVQEWSTVLNAEIVVSQLIG
jgi:hypothetical protein